MEGPRFTGHRKRGEFHQYLRVRHRILLRIYFRFLADLSRQRGENQHFQACGLTFVQQGCIWREQRSCSLPTSYLIGLREAPAQRWSWVLSLSAAEPDSPDHAGRLPTQGSKRIAARSPPQETPCTI